MNTDKVKDLREKIISGIELAYQRLLIEKQKDDSYLVFSENGKIIKVKARDIAKK